MSLSKYPEIMPIGRTDEIVIQEADQEMLVYDLKTNKASHLNPTAKLVWQNCDGKSSVAEVSKLLADKLNTDITNEVVILALKDLEEADLLENTFLAEDNIKVSRRDLIARYGIPMATLPVIMSLVAPVAAGMASCIDTGGACTPAGTPCCVDTCTGGICTE